ncbi:P-loop containing nucleoside triphosphate hydrolase protein, partial [Pavlovales sp. CCMP2436]
TGKSVIARALRDLLPPITVVRGSSYNIDPRSAEGDADTFLRAELRASGKLLSDLETAEIPAPFVSLPLNCGEDRLVGSVDIEKSLASGETGLLARAHRGVLLVDDINLLDSGIANVLLSSISAGEVVVEREGLSRYPCSPILIATFNPKNEELRDHLLNRFG